jgi:hypothetical protein
MHPHLMVFKASCSQSAQPLFVIPAIRLNACGELVQWRIVSVYRSSFNLMMRASIAIKPKRLRICHPRRISNHLAELLRVRSRIQQPSSAGIHKYSLRHIHCNVYDFAPSGAAFAALPRSPKSKPNHVIGK